MMTDDLDARLAQLFELAAREPDETFVQKVAVEVAAEQRVEALRKRMRHKLLIDALSAAAIVAAFFILALGTQIGPEGMELIPFSPAMLGVCLLGLWAATTLPAGITEARG